MIKDRRRYCNWKEGAVGNDPVANTDWVMFMRSSEYSLSTACY
jgi:hypothetical protein